MDVSYSPAPSKKKVSPQRGNLTAMRMLTEVQQLIERKRIHTLEPFLPLLFNLKGKPFSLDRHFHFAPLFMTRRPRIITFKTARQVGKCIKKSHEPCIRLADGRLVGSADVKVGDRLVSVDKQFRTTTGRVVRIFQTGRKTILRLTTRMGHVLEISPEHRIRTLLDYVQADQLKIGDRVCAIRQSGTFGCKAMADSRIILTALLLGDGSCLKCGLTLTTGCDEVLRIGQQWPHLAPVNQVRVRKGTHHVHYSLDRKYALRQWLTEDKLWGKHAWEKHIPDWVFQLSRKKLRVFLSHLFATDGSIKPPQTIDYCSTSRLMAIQVRSLLNKFGIPTSIRCKPSGYKKKDGTRKMCRDAWIVRVETREGLATFFQNFNVPGKPAFALRASVENNNRDTVPSDVQQLIDVLAKRIAYKHRNSLLSAGLRKTLSHPPQREKLRRYVQHFEHCRFSAEDLEPLRSCLSRDVIWDEIVSIEQIGTHETVDFEIETEHNFAIDGICTHNSQSIAVDGLTLLATIKGFGILFLTPVYEQIRRFSTLYVRPLIQDSPFRGMWLGTNTEKSVLQRTFKNGSKAIFSFVLHDPSRVRGLSVNMTVFDEIQDADPATLPVIKSCTDWDEVYELQRFSGTSKVTNDALAQKWTHSSQAEWWIPCMHCTTNGHRTWNIPSSDHHLLKMLGPNPLTVRRRISAQEPALVCWKCGGCLYAPMGHWEHRHKDRRWTHAGYHIPQPIVPLHYEHQHKWIELMGKMRDTVAFFNEILGEAMDAGQKMMTQQELKNACCLKIPNRPDEPGPEVMARLGQYRSKVLAIDWGGGGEKGISTTAFALLGLTAEGKIDCLWGKRMLGIDHIAEAREACKYFQLFGCQHVAHDYTGAGGLRETLMIMAGIPVSRIVPIAYGSHDKQDMVVIHSPEHEHKREWWQIDKPRSLNTTITMIRTGLLRFFNYDYVNEDEIGLVEDFMRLIQNRTKIETFGSMYRIISDGTGPDDFAQAVNIGCVALWELFDCYPDFTQAINLEFQLDPRLMQYLEGDWSPDDWMDAIRQD